MSDEADYHAFLQQVSLRDWVMNVNKIVARTLRIDGLVDGHDLG